MLDSTAASFKISAWVVERLLAQQLAVIGPGEIQGSRRVMTEDPVFSHEDSDRSFSILKE